MRRPRLKAAALPLAAAALALPSAAHANDFQTVYREYKRTGTVKPCRFSDRQLKSAEQQTPPDVEQYAPSFLDAVTSAREQSSGCAKKASTPAPAPAPAAPAAPTGGSPTPSTPAPVPASTAPVPTATTPATTTPAPAVPATPTLPGVALPAVDHPKRDDSAPAVVWLLAVLGALALLAAVAAAASWWFGWSPEGFTRPWRASFSEFAERFSAGRSEFVDWLRTGH